MEDISEKVLRFVEAIKNSINCQCPAQINKVNEDGIIPKNTEFIVEFINGNIQRPFTTTK